MIVYKYLFICVRFEQRHKTLNYFSVMLSKKVQNKEDDETKPSELVNSL